MQIELFAVIISIIASMLAIPYSIIKLIEWIKENRKLDFKVVVKEAVHTKEGAHFIHYLSVDILNNTERRMKIINMRVRDRKNNELRLIRREQKYPYTEFEIDGNETQLWDCFFERESTGDTERAKIKLGIDTRLGKRTKWVKISSVRCEPGELPSGFIFAVF